MYLHWKIRNQRGVSTWWNCLRGHLCELRREKFGKLHKGSCWAALPEVSLCKPSVALCASLSPSPSSEEIKLDVRIEGETWVRWDHKPSRRNPWKQPWLLRVAFAVCSAAKDPPESCRFIGLGLIPIIPALLQPGFWDVRTAGWHSATQHVSPGRVSIPYAEHTNSSFYSLR